MIHVGYVSATVEQVFHPDAEVIGDIGATVTALADALHQRVTAGAGISRRCATTSARISTSAPRMTAFR